MKAETNAKRDTKQKRRQQTKKILSSDELKNVKAYPKSTLDLMYRKFGTYDNIVRGHFANFPLTMPGGRMEIILHQYDRALESLKYVLDTNKEFSREVSEAASKWGFDVGEVLDDIHALVRCLGREECLGLLEWIRMERVPDDYSVADFAYINWRYIKEPQKYVSWSEDDDEFDINSLPESDQDYLRSEIHRRH